MAIPDVLRRRHLVTLAVCLLAACTLVVLSGCGGGDTESTSTGTGSVASGGGPPAPPPSGNGPPSGNKPQGAPVEGFEIGNIAPEIIGEDIDGQSFRLSDYRGQVVVLDFWGDW